MNIEDAEKIINQKITNISQATDRFNTQYEMLEESGRAFNEYLSTIEKIVSSLDLDLNTTQVSIKSLQQEVDEISETYSGLMSDFEQKSKDLIACEQSAFAHCEKEIQQCIWDIKEVNAASVQKILTTNEIWQKTISDDMDKLKKSADDIERQMTVNKKSISSVKGIAITCLIFSVLSLIGVLVPLVLRLLEL